jgi:FixJ family two-component response regulator
VAVEVSSVPLMRGERIIGVFGQLFHHPVEPTPAHPALTPRQAEVLRLLEHGRSTRQIAEELHLSPETVRNHVRAVLRGPRCALEARGSRARASPAPRKMTRLEQTVRA